MEYLHQDKLHFHTPLVQYLHCEITEMHAIAVHKELLNKMKTQ